MTSNLGKIEEDSLFLLLSFEDGSRRNAVVCDEIDVLSLFLVIGCVCVYVIEREL